MNYNLKAKVADFGLAARMYMRSNNNKQIGANMDTFPFTCSAFEILQTGVAIKEKSDVWSFGVLMWEIFYLGEALPYADIAGLPELVSFLETHQRLEKPPLCPQDLYEFRAVVSGGAGGTLAPPEFGSSLNPIPARGGRLCPPHYW